MALSVGSAVLASPQAFFTVAFYYRRSGRRRWCNCIFQSVIWPLIVSGTTRPSALHTVRVG